VVVQISYRCFAKDEMDIYNQLLEGGKLDECKNMQIKFRGPKKFLFRLHRQFRFNVYLRWFTVVYFDLVFTHLLEVKGQMSDSKDISNSVIIATLVLAVCVIVPVIIMIYLCAQFKELTDKKHKQNFNSLLLKVDKASRTRIAIPAFFFIRRFVTALVLAFVSNETAQYLFVFIMSFCYFLYISATEPYVKRTTNSYVAAVELLYFVLIAVAFLLTDACADADIKILAAWISVVLLMAYILANIIVTIRLVRRTKEELKVADKRYKTYRKKEMNRRQLEKYEKDLRAKAREDRKNEKL